MEKQIKLVGKKDSKVYFEEGWWMEYRDWMDVMKLKLYKAGWAKNELTKQLTPFALPY